MKTYTAWRQYEFRIQANTLNEAYEKFIELEPKDATDCESWVDDTDYEDEE